VVEFLIMLEHLPSGLCNPSTLLKFSHLVDIGTRYVYNSSYSPGVEDVKIMFSIDLF